MRIALACLMVLHGGIHMLGFAKGFGFMEVSALKLPIGRTAGASWLLVALGFVAAAVMLFVTPTRWWLVALPVVILSQVLIILAWSDARFGTIPNLIVLLPLLLAMLEASPNSLQSMYERASAMHLARVTHTGPLVTAKELEPLPPLIQRYLVRVGIVGKPHVQGFISRYVGRFRNGFDAPWMEFHSEQHNFVNPSARFFFMRASWKGIPTVGFHSFTNHEARMRIRVASLFDVVDARGPEMNQGETVTIFNDLCLQAPGALVDLPVRWTTVDAQSVRGVFTRGDQTVSAVLTFNEEGDLVDFVSEDRFHSADGKTYVKMPWSTPVRGYRDSYGIRLPARGDATWKTPQGDFVYGEFNLVEMVYF